MSDLGAAVQHVVDQLVAGGIRATADGRSLNPPAVLVRAPALAWRFKGGTWDATWTAHAVVPDSGQVSALRNLGELLERVQAALGGLVVSARPTELSTEDGATLPGYELTWTTRIT